MEVNVVLGDMIGEFKGTTTGVRVLTGGTIESSGAGPGRILGTEAQIYFTGVTGPLPNGVFTADGDGLIMTINGDSVIWTLTGIGWPTGKGQKSSYRGASYQTTEAAELTVLNKVVGVYEIEYDENGDWDLKIWEWK